MSTIENTVEKDATDGDKKKTEFHCQICDKYYASYKSFGNHTRSYHSTNKQKAKCEYCGNCFTRKDNLQQHIRLFHTAMQTTFPCKFCGEMFTSRNMLSKHKLECPSKSSGKKAPLAAQSNKHAEAKTFIVYTPGKLVRDHQQPNTEEKPYSQSTRRRGRKPNRVSQRVSNSDEFAIINNNNNNVEKQNHISAFHENQEEESKALDCHVCNTTFLSERDYLLHKPFCDDCTEKSC